MSMRFGLFPVPPPMKEKSRVYDLKARLDWGEPALTIIDIRDRSEFRQRHITGAICMPMDELVNRALVSLELVRDIYVYGDTNEEAAMAATKLRESGFLHVSEIEGGLPAWKAYGYPIESGIAREK